MPQRLLPLTFPVDAISFESKGIVYTKPWVVELLLDLAGYRPERNLVDSVVVEPSAGEGAFLVQLAQRLILSCLRQNRPISDCHKSIIAYEIDSTSSDKACSAVSDSLVSIGIDSCVAYSLARGWIRTGDYLLESSSLQAADFVIGNPPYVRLEDIPGEVANIYRSAYPTMKGRADLYVGFFEAALRQLRKDGVCAFICADRWMLNQYGAELRKFVTAGYDVGAIVEMHNANAFDDEVSAYPAITIIRRRSQRPTVVASIKEFDESRPSISITEALNAAASGREPELVKGLTLATIDEWFTGSAPWPCSSPTRLALLRRLEAEFEPVESSETGTKVGIGVATGCDKVFITKDADLVERARLLPLAMASDTVSGNLEWSGNFLVDPWNCKGLANLSEFPRFAAYVEQHREVLSKRHVAKRNLSGWYKTIDRVSHTLTAKPKLYIPDIKDRFNPVLDRGTTYPHHNLYFITSEKWDLEVLGGLLLSTVGQLFIESYGVRMRGGYFRFQAQYLRRICVPKPQSLTKTQSKILIQAFRSRDRTMASEISAEIYRMSKQELEVIGEHRF